MFLTRGFTQRVLPFDLRAAEAYAPLKGARDRAGRPLGGYDAMIGAIARIHGAGVVTRNVADFTECLAWRCRKSMGRVATTVDPTSATTNRIERTPSRPPRRDRRPSCLPLSLAIGANPASLATALLERVPISGISAMRRATVR